VKNRENEIQPDNKRLLVVNREEGSSGPADSTFSLFRDSWGRLVLAERDGKQHVGIEIMRAFPITDPDHWISICDADGHEILSIEDPSTLSREVHHVIAEELNLREFLPIIQRIIKVSTTSDPSEWQVETDRGITRFMLNDEDDVHRLDTHRILIIDAHGIRYLIPDTRRLDFSSRRILSRYI
jgi:hypothetical protein